MIDLSYLLEKQAPVVENRLNLPVNTAQLILIVRWSVQIWNEALGHYQLCNGTALHSDRPSLYPSLVLTSFDHFLKILSPQPDTPPL